MFKYFNIFLFCISFSSFSQTHISGIVTNSNAEPAQFLPIGLLSLPDSTLVKGSLTDEFGRYFIELDTIGRYILKLVLIGGHEEYSNEIVIDSISKKEFTIDVKLNDSRINLDEVSISSIKPTVEFKNGNIIVNVENSPLAKGNTVYSLLAKLPGVRINNNIIQLNGKSGVIIMIDGKVQNLTNIQLVSVLKSMNADLVEKIELLKNPPVKYDASGTSGIINIKTKKTNIIGYSGMLSLASSQGAYGRSMLSSGLNYKSKRILLFSELNYNYSTFENKYTSNRLISDDSIITEFNFVNKTIDLDNGLTFKIGGDWNINKNAIIGFKIDGGPGFYKSNGRGRNTIFMDNNMGFDHLDVSSSTDDKWNRKNYNMNSEFHFDTLGTVLNFNTDYSMLKGNILSQVRNNFFDKYDQESLPENCIRSETNNSSGILASRLDYTKVFNSKTSIELGTKLSFIEISNKFNFKRKDNTTGNYIADSILTNDYNYKENTYALYLNYIKSIRKVSCQIGFRFEFTDLVGINSLKGFELKKSYLQFYPNISLSYSASEIHSFQLNLNRRIDRPPYDILMPFYSYQDQYNYFEGNPSLSPDFSNNIELTHSYKDMITNSITYTRVNDVWFYYTKQNDSSKIISTTYTNLKCNNYYAYSFFIKHSIKDWWEISVNGLAAYIEYIGNIDGKAFRNGSMFYVPSITNTFIAPKETKLEIITFYNSKKNQGFYQTKSLWMLSLAIKKSFFKEKLDCSIGVDDLFYSYVTRNEIKSNDQNWNFRSTSDTRRIVVSINYNFGKSKVDKRIIDVENSEKNRLKH